MAKRKSRKKTTHRKHSRRRVSGLKGMDLTSLLLMGGGAVAANRLSTAMSKSTNTTMQKVAPYVGVAAGVVGKMLMKDPTVGALSDGLVAGGFVEALKGLKVISGNGFDPIPVIAGGRRLPYSRKPGGMGYPLPAGSQYNNPMSVVSGIGNAAGDGSCTPF